MGIIMHVAVVALVFLAVVASSADARCPPQNWVRGPECREDYDCRKGICCPNWLGKKSCVYNYRHILKNSISNTENNEINKVYDPDDNNPYTENDEDDTIIKNIESNDIFEPQSRDKAKRNLYKIENRKYLKKKPYNTMHYEVMNSKPFENDELLGPSNTKLSPRVLPLDMNGFNKSNLYIERIKEDNQYEIRKGNKTTISYRTIHHILNLEPESSRIGSYRNALPTFGRPRFSSRYHSSATNLKYDVSSGVYCNGVKCKPWQVCKPDKWGKLTCQ